jgi:hypothetical protein
MSVVLAAPMEGERRGDRGGGEDMRATPYLLPPPHLTSYPPLTLVNAGGGEW